MTKEQFVKESLKTYNMVANAQYNSQNMEQFMKAEKLMNKITQQMKGEIEKCK